MDPTACLERWRKAMRERDREEEDDARSDLLGWVARGGFEPKWQQGERNKFFNGKG
jgi:hypothetical protein